VATETPAKAATSLMVACFLKGTSPLSVFFFILSQDRAQKQQFQYCKLLCNLVK
jgi:hypothetical protein